MGIRQGKNGSLNVFYKDLFIASYPLNDKRTVDGYKKNGEWLILSTMRERPELNIKNQIYTYTYFLNLMYNRKLNNKNIWRSNYELILGCVMALIKLDILDYDDCIFCQPIKRPSRISSRVPS
tara:strand:+ start:239 stop:607 length:369 start_codon:yes stop_codon:yes gene_type:complete